MSIICLAGKKGSGKDTFGDVLVKKHGFSRIALADPLRELCSKVFRLDYNLFLDADKKDKPLEEKVTLDFHHIDRMREYLITEWGFNVTYEQREALEDFHGEVFKTPREILQIVGTNMLRHIIRDDIWIVLAASKVKELGQKVVITDCRFENERDVFAKAGAILVLIKRPSTDDGSTSNHASENNVGEDDEYDVIFHNTEAKHVFENEVTLWYMSRANDLTGQKKFEYEY